MNLMKRIVLLLFACFGLTVVSSAQAADVTLMFYSQNGNAPVAVAHDAHYSLTSADGEEVAIADGTAPNVAVTVEEGAYNLIVEQASTHLFGTVSVYISEKQDAPMLFLLSQNGLTYLEGIHPCDCDANNCDDNCICEVFDENVTDEVCHCSRECPCRDKGIAKATQVKPQVRPQTFNNQPFNPQPAQNYGYGYARGGWAAIGMIGAITASVVALSTNDNNDHPVNPSAMRRVF